jgi:hypothetical protein
MIATWTDLEGTVVGAWRLEAMLRADNEGAYFCGRAADGQPSLVRLWFGERDVISVRHPSLMQIWEIGRSTWDGITITFVAMEMPDEDLGGVLAERALTEDETRQALRAVTPALAYLHARGKVHGAIAPARVVAIGDRIKLTSDSISNSGDSAADMRALGLATYAMLTQSMEPDGARIGLLPKPFGDIVRGCLAEASGERWNAERVSLALDQPAAAVVAGPVVIPVEPEPKRWNPVWTYLTVGVGLAGLGIYLSNRQESAAMSQTADRKVEALRPAATPPPPVTERPRPSPFAPIRSATAPATAETAPATAETAPATAEKDEGPRIWRVIAYTYSRDADAVRMVATINKQWPQLHAEIFSPRGAPDVKYVAVGGQMTRAQALQLQRQAIEMGLPHDTFARNFKP